EDGIRDGHVTGVKTCALPICFFDTRPVLLFPALNGLLISLQGAPFWFLRTPVQSMHQPSDMITMVLDSEFTANQFRNAGGGPEIGSVAVHHRPLQEKRDQTPSLLPIQLQRSTWGETHPQPLLSTPASCITPAHHRTCIAADAPPNLI